MNIFNCYNNMQISRYAAIKYAQRMANGNLATLFNASMNNGWGVLTSITTDGLIPAEDTSLKVTRKAGSNTLLEIQPGVAITPAGEIAINARLATINAATVVGTDYGLYNLYIKHKTEYLMTGEEKFYSGHTSSIMGTIEQDSCEFELTKAIYADQVLLATVLCLSGAYLLVPDISVGTARLAEGTVIYPTDTAIAWEGITTITGKPYFSSQPYVLVGEEYLQNTGTNLWSRGQYNTNPSVYYEGNHAMYWSPIVDQRQINCFRLNMQIGSLDTLSSGIIQRGSTYRHLELIAKKDAPAIPVLNSDNTEIVWLNSHLAAGYLTADMIAAYEEVQGTQESISNTLTIINQLNTDYSEAAGDPATQTRLEYEIQKQQMSLLDYRTHAANLKAKLATRTMDSIRYADLRQFAYSISVQEPVHTDSIDEPVQYEVEVEYGIADSPKDNVASAIVRWFYSRRRNVYEIDWSTMERTYEDTARASGEYNVIYIPIKFGERIKWRMRAIGESGIMSEFSAYYSYSFTGYSVSQQYIMVNNIYNLLYPDPYQEGIINQNLVDLLYSVIDDYRDKTDRIVAIENQINTLISEV